MEKPKQGSIDILAFVLISRIDRSSKYIYIYIPHREIRVTQKLFLLLHIFFEPSRINFRAAQLFANATRAHPVRVTSHTHAYNYPSTISYTSYAWLNTLEKNFYTIHRCQIIFNKLKFKSLAVIHETMYFLII